MSSQEMARWRRARKGVSTTLEQDDAVYSYGESWVALGEHAVRYAGVCRDSRDCDRVRSATYGITMTRVQTGALLRES